MLTPIFQIFRSSVIIFFQVVSCPPSKVFDLIRRSSVDVTGSTNRMKVFADHY